VVKKNPRSLELLKFKKSEIVVTHIQILKDYSTFMQTKASQLKSFRDQRFQHQEASRSGEGTSTPYWRLRKKLQKISTSKGNQAKRTICDIKDIL